MEHVRISKGNAKLGAIPSVSLPSGKTCVKGCGCLKKCYARKFERMRPNVRQAYEQNLRLLTRYPDIYWREVEASIMMSHFFRFHVSGDIPDSIYFAHMIVIAERNNHCEILCFTKRYDIVNQYLAFGGVIPKNLHIIFSAWAGMKMDNPYNLPEAHIEYKDGTKTTMSEDIRHCGGNCTQCVQTDGGCWFLKEGEKIMFKEH